MENLSDKTYFTNNFTYLWNKMYSSGKEYHIAQQIITQIVVIWVEKQILLSKLIKDNTVIEKQWKDIVLSSIDRKKMDFIIEYVYLLQYLENWIVNMIRHKYIEKVYSQYEVLTMSLGKHSDIRTI